MSYIHLWASMPSVCRHWSFGEKRSFQLKIDVTGKKGSFENVDD